MRLDFAFVRVFGVRAKVEVIISMRDWRLTLTMKSLRHLKLQLDYPCLKVEVIQKSFIGWGNCNMYFKLLPILTFSRQTLIYFCGLKFEVLLNYFIMADSALIADSNNKKLRHTKKTLAFFLQTKSKVNWILLEIKDLSRDLYSSNEIRLYFRQRVQCKCQSRGHHMRDWRLTLTMKSLRHLKLQLDSPRQRCTSSHVCRWRT